MKSRFLKSAYILSFLAVLWLTIPCELHCWFETPSSAREIGHDCCDSHPQSDSSDTFHQICEITSGYYVSPTLYYYHSYESRSFPIVDSYVSTINPNINNTVPIIALEHSPLGRIKSQILSTCLYTPHAPPILS